MKSHTKHLSFNIPERMGFTNITRQITDEVKQSGISEGLCLVNAMHITASVFINDDKLWFVVTAQGELFLETTTDLKLIEQKMGVLIIHGHFYQPPRENPWTGRVDPEPSAHPFHDWNERVYAECYQPNSAVRIVDAKSKLEQIVNNYEQISFDFGPTLLSWLERQHPETYARIIAADVASADKHGGHGNALAQAYNHTILPLSNERDQRTQIRWGLADFHHRFNRGAEGMWLAETARNDDGLCFLIDEGLRFVILAAPP